VQQHLINGGVEIALAKQPPKVKYVRPPKERQPTRQDRELVHDIHVWDGSRDPSGNAFAKPINADETWFRHHFWRAKRAKVMATLAAAGTGIAAMCAFSNCGAECVLEWCEEEKRHRIRGSYCHNRHCEPCMRAKASLLARNLRDKLASNPNGQYRFITLTLRHTKTPLADQIKRLNTCFKKLRASKVWTTTQRGGAAMLEVKWDPETREWHPHLHVVGEGVFLDKRELESAWHKATGDSFVIDIRCITKGKDVAYYVAKYVSKGTNREVWDDPAAAVEWVVAMRGVRSCATFGNWRGHKLLAQPKDKAEWRPVARLSQVIAKARAGHLQSILLLESLQEALQYNPNKKRGKRPESG
jgi:hypothetical protein